MTQNVLTALSETLLRFSPSLPSCPHLPLDVQYAPMRMIRILDSANAVVITGKL